ncbi:hypothetical protein ACQEVG_30030 [Streptomyces sp. CA-135486]|uniref:hypothetical protein n=1 Tax=Streptomyces sp. CA-135486 TaxID=3240049 RepID=UPI003D917F89
MWPGEQGPGGGQHVNPYQQQGQAPWGPPTAPIGTPPTPPGGRGRTPLVAVAAATVVVIAAAVTGFLVLGGGKDDTAGPGPAKSTPAAPSTGPTGDKPRGVDDLKPLVPGWKVVVNPRSGIAFDVPPEWGLKSPGWASYVSDEKDPEEKPLIGFSAPAMLKEKWCTSDDNKDGSPEDTPLAGVGSRSERGARTLDEAARDNASLWVYGAYTQPDKAKVRTGAVEPYTTKSGITGSLASAESSGVAKKGKCDTDGKATSFALKDPKGDFLSWTFLGVKGVQGEVPVATVRRILSTVRLVAGSSTP